MRWQSVRARWTLSRIFIGVGVAVLVPLGVAALIVLGVQSAHPWPTVEAQVIRAAPPAYGGRLAVVRYSVEEHVYNEELTLGEEVTVGERITIRYDPEHPRQIALGAPVIWVPILLGALGVGLFLVFGGVGLLVRKVAGP